MKFISLQLFIVYVASSNVLFCARNFHSRRIWYEKPAPENGADLWRRFLERVSWVLGNQTDLWMTLERSLTWAACKAFTALFSCVVMRCLETASSPIAFDDASPTLQRLLLRICRQAKTASNQFNAFGTWISWKIPILTFPRIFTTHFRSRTLLKIWQAVQTSAVKQRSRPNR